MAKRKKLTMRASKKLFSKKAKPHRKNASGGKSQVMRGGIRL